MLTMLTGMCLLHKSHQKTNAAHALHCLPHPLPKRSADLASPSQAMAGRRHDACAVCARHGIG